MKRTFVIEDYFQKRFNTSSRPFLKDIVLILLIYIFYMYSESNVLIMALKLSVILFVLRYILSVVTNIKHLGSRRRYFQINGNVLLFSIIILLMSKAHVLDIDKAFGLGPVLIISYSLLVISTRQHYTSDIIMTILLTYSLVTNNYILAQID